MGLTMSKIKVMTDTNNEDLLNDYLCEIKNFKLLNDGMINNIKNMSDESKMEIIQTYNEMIKYAVIFILESK
jgi:hypothetical protein